MLITSLLFGISASLDALLVGVSFGIRRVRIKSWQNLMISLITLLGTCLSVGLGHQLTTVLPGSVADYGGCLILTGLGLYYLFKWCTKLFKDKRTKAPPWPDTSPAPPAAMTSADLPVSANDAAPGSAADRKPGFSFSLTLPEVFFLSLTLSLNNLGLGLSASLGGLPLVPAAVSTFLCSVLFLSAGNRLGGHPILQLAGQTADPLSGLLLIGLGLLQLYL